MRVLLLAPQPYFSHRGTPMNVRLMLSTLSAAGVEVDLLTYPGGDDTPMTGLTIHRVGVAPGGRRAPIGPSRAKLLLDARMVPAAWRLARRGGYRLVHAVEESVYIGILLKSRFGLRLIYDMDSSLREQLIDYGYARDRLTQSLLEKMERWAILRSDGVITVCRALTDIVSAVDPAKPVFQIEDVPLCADGMQVPPDAAELEARMAGRSVLLYTGNFEPYQGLPLLLEAMPGIVEERGDALLVLVGGSGRNLESFLREVRRRGLEKAVLTVPPRPPGQMDWFMARAFALVSPRTKGINTPLKIYTYLRSGRPIVATRLVTHTQVLEDGWAMLTEPTGPGMARGVLQLLADPGLARALGHRGKMIVEEKYSRAGFQKKLLEAYRRIGGVEAS